MLAVVPLYGWAVSRWSRRRLVPMVYASLAAIMVACWLAGLWLPASGQAPLAAFVFVFISVFNVFVVSVFWSLLADLYAPLAGRRLFGFVAAGGTIGALAGPTLAATFVLWLPPARLLVVAAFFVAGAAFAATRLQPAPAGGQRASPIGGGLWRGFVLLLGSPRLRGISLYLLCMTWISTILYFEQAQIVEAAISDSAERTGLFARMDLTVNVLALIVQLLLTGRIIRRFGLVLVLIALPLVSGAALVAVGAMPILGVIVAVSVIKRAINFALSRPAREVLFTDVSDEEKYKGKNVVDTVVYRGGDAVAGWAFSGLQFVGLGLSTIAWVSVPVAVAWTALGRRLGRDAGG
jgi:AAA family ATP:ADP antiporter